MTAPLWVAVDIGCIECGETSAVLGVFSSKEQAQSACDEHQARLAQTRSGQHSFEVFGVDGIDVIHKRDY